MGIRIEIDGCRSFSVQGAPLAPTLAEPVERGAPWPHPLADDGWYVIELPSDHLRDGAERMPMLHSKGLWLTVGDAAYEDGPIPVDLAGYKIVSMLDLWTD